MKNFKIPRNALQLIIVAIALSTMYACGLVSRQQLAQISEEEETIEVTYDADCDRHLSKFNDGWMLSHVGCTTGPNGFIEKPQYSPAMAKGFVVFPEGFDGRAVSCQVEVADDQVTATCNGKPLVVGQLMPYGSVKIADHLQFNVMLPGDKAGSWRIFDPELDIKEKQFDVVRTGQIGFAPR